MLYRRLPTATSTDALWPGQPKPNPELTVLARDAMAKWSPATHWLHHERFREAVHTMLLLAGRLCNAAQPNALPILPALMWREVLGGAASTRLLNDLRRTHRIRLHDPFLKLAHLPLAPRRAS